MPTFTRKALRQSLGRYFLRDTIVSTVTGSVATGGSFVVLDSTQANAAFSGRQMYEDNWIKVHAAEFRVASFNAPSGAYVMMQPLGTLLNAGVEYEHHMKLSPADKDGCLNQAIQGICLEKEICLPGVRDALNYLVASVNAACSPHVVRKVLDVYYYADPTNTGNRGRRSFVQHGVVTTGSGEEIRVSSAISDDQQLAVLALLEVTLGSLDTASVEIPDDTWVLWRAAAWAYWLLERDAPGQEANKYRTYRRDCALEFTRLSTRFQPVAAKSIQLRTPV